MKTVHYKKTNIILDTVFRLGLFCDKFRKPGLFSSSVRKGGKETYIDWPLWKVWSSSNNSVLSAKDENRSIRKSVVV